MKLAINMNRAELAWLFVLCKHDNKRRIRFILGARPITRFAFLVNTNEWLFTTTFSFVAPTRYIKIMQMFSLLTPPQHAFTFFQDSIVNLVGGLAVVKDSPRCRRNVQAFGARAEIFRLYWLWCQRHVPILRDLVLVDRVVTVSRPNVNFLPKVLNHLLERMMIAALWIELFFRIVWATASVAAVDAALWNARIELANEARVVKTVF